jgi:hypothetical protein
MRAKSHTAADVTLIRIKQDAFFNPDPSTGRRIAPRRAARIGRKPGLTATAKSNR